MIFRHRFPAASVGLLLALLPAHADDKLSITLAPRGLAAGDKPLPPGATASVRVIVQNDGTSALTRIHLKAAIEGLKADGQPGWRADGSSFSAEIARLAAGDKIERTFSARVDSPPPVPATARIALEVRSDDGGNASAEARIPIADCAGAYRARIAPIRADQIAAVRKLAEEIRKAEPGLPRGRIFPSTGARTGPLANVERLAAQFAATAGADTELAKEGMRWLVLRTTAELGNYVSQEKNPGLCTGVSEFLTIYRNSMVPLTRRLDAISAAAKTALAAAREETKAADDDLAGMARKIANKAGVEGTENGAPVFAIFMKTRDFLADKDKKLEADDARALSLTETAAWLAAAGKRADALGMAFSGTLAAIAAAHKDTCVCAY